MMNPKQKCMICGGPTQLGFSLDRGEGDRRRQEEWWADKPTKSFRMGLKEPPERDMIVTLRCTRRGYLMKFANPEE